MFGKIENGIMELNAMGQVVCREILKIESHYQNIKIDKYVIMPNHVHMIITILEQTNRVAVKYDIPNVVGKFKAAVTRNVRHDNAERINPFPTVNGAPLCNLVGNAFMHSAKNGIWQTSYNDHIIRGDEDYKKIWEYIDTNVARWEKDCFYKQDAEM